MAFCAECGQGLERGHKFCSGCGAVIAMNAMSGAAFTANTIRPYPRDWVVEWLRAAAGICGWAALAGLAVAVFLEVESPLTAQVSQDQSRLALFSFCSGSACLTLNLLRWNRHELPGRRRGAVMVGGFLLIVTLFGSQGGSGGVTPDAIAAAYPPAVAAGTVSPTEILLRDVEVAFEWRKVQSGPMLFADFTVTNPTKYKFKDFEIRCAHYAPSGTEIDSNVQTIYEAMNADSTRTFTGVNMGFIHSRPASSQCSLRNFKLMP